MNLMILLKYFIYKLLNHTFQCGHPQKHTCCGHFLGLPRQITRPDGLEQKCILSVLEAQSQNELPWAQVTVSAAALSLWKLEWRPVPSLLHFPMAANILWLGATSPISALESHHLLLFWSQISLCLPLKRTSSVHVEPGLVIQDNFPNFKSLHRKCFLAIESYTHRFQGLRHDYLWGGAGGGTHYSASHTCLQIHRKQHRGEHALISSSLLWFHLPQVPSTRNSSPTSYLFPPYKLPVIRRKPLILYSLKVLVFVMAPEWEP